MSSSSRESRWGFGSSTLGEAISDHRVCAMPIFRLCSTAAGQRLRLESTLGAIAAQASDSSMTWFCSPWRMSGQPFGAAARATVQSGSITSLPRMGCRGWTPQGGSADAGKWAVSKTETEVQKDDGQPVHNKAVASAEPSATRTSPPRPFKFSQREMGCRHQLYLDGTGLVVPGRHASTATPGASSAGPWAFA